MVELLDKSFRTTIIKMLQSALKNLLERNEKKKSLQRNSRYKVQLRTTKCGNTVSREIILNEKNIMNKVIDVRIWCRFDSREVWR